MHRRRPSYLIALVLAVAMAVPLLLDIAAFTSSAWPFQRLTRSHGEIEPLLGPRGPERYLSVLVGLAAREVAGGPPQRTLVPSDLESLRYAGHDVFEGAECEALDEDLIAPLLGGGLRSRDYDPRLTEEQLVRATSVTDAVELPRGVVALVPRGGWAEEVVMHVSPDGERIYALPLRLSPLAEEG